MKNLRDENIYMKLVRNETDWMSAFRDNIGILRTYYGWSVRVLSDKTGIPENTLNNIIKGRTNDCSQSITVKLAKAFNVSVDELIGSETIDPITEESFAICRTLPEHSLYMVRYFIRHQEKLYQKHNNNKKIISVFKPQCVRGQLLTTNVVEPLSIDHLPDSTKSLVYVGFRIPCDHYMPYYAPDDTVLVAADRKGISGERCVITHQDRILIVTKQSYIENGKKEWKYVNLMNEDLIIPESEIDDKIGYIVGFLNPDGSWGIR